MVGLGLAGGLEVCGYTAHTIHGMCSFPEALRRQVALVVLSPFLRTLIPKVAPCNMCAYRKMGCPPNRK